MTVAVQLCASLLLLVPSLLPLLPARHPFHRSPCLLLPLIPLVYTPIFLTRPTHYPKPGLPVHFRSGGGEDEAVITHNTLDTLPLSSPLIPLPTCLSLPLSVSLPLYNPLSIQLIPLPVLLCLCLLSNPSLFLSFLHLPVFLCLCLSPFLCTILSIPLIPLPVLLCLHVCFPDSTQSSLYSTHSSAFCLYISISFHVSLFKSRHINWSLFLFSTVCFFSCEISFYLSLYNSFLVYVSLSHFRCLHLSFHVSISQSFSLQNSFISSTHNFFYVLYMKRKLKLYLKIDIYNKLCR